MLVLIYGDFVPTQNNVKEFVDGNIRDLFSEEVLKLFSSVDFSIINLECPLIKPDMRPIIKNGPSLGANDESIRGISALNPSLVCLANNHINDYGREGIINTMKRLSEANISFTGIGEGGVENGLYVNGNLAVVNYCEREFSFNPRTDFGANILVESRLYQTIRDEKADGKTVVFVFHGGKEQYRYPTPEQQRVCRAAVDFGADLVVCQHSHVIGSMEKYKDSVIVYGQGNFHFDSFSSSDDWTTSLGILFDTDSKTIQFIPTKMIDGKVILLHGDDSEKVLSSFFLRSEKCSSPELIKKEFVKESGRSLTLFLCALAGYSHLRTAIEFRIFKGRFIRKRYRKKICQIYNLIGCETHREVLLSLLSEEIFC